MSPTSQSSLKVRARSRRTVPACKHRSSNGGSSYSRKIFRCSHSLGALRRVYLQNRNYETETCESVSSAATSQQPCRNVGVDNARDITHSGSARRSCRPLNDTLPSRCRSGPEDCQTKISWKASRRSGPSDMRELALSPVGDGTCPNHGATLPCRNGSDSRKRQKSWGCAAGHRGGRPRQWCANS